MPQTLLIPVRQLGVDVDEPCQALEFGRQHASRLLATNPNLQLHQTHDPDPNQDRLMAQRMAYFRVKWRQLGEAYSRFLHEGLEPGGSIVLVECCHSWPTTLVGSRHVFQFGGSGAPRRRSTSEAEPG